MDTSNATYRITFDRVGLGTHSIPDYEGIDQSEHSIISIDQSHFSVKVDGEAKALLRGLLY